MQRIRTKARKYSYAWNMLKEFGEGYFSVDSEQIKRFKKGLIKEKYEDTKFARAHADDFTRIEFIELTLHEAVVRLESTDAKSLYGNGFVVIHAILKVYS